MSVKSSTKEGITLDEIFAPGGILQRQLSNYEYRSSQRVMAETVLDAIQNEYPLCVEAGTGTGKTLAYLIPALFSQKRVIVSTATKNLQDQLFFKDIPFIREYLFPDLAVTYMKGRQNYLCLWKFHEQSRQEEVFEGAQGERKALSEWVEKTETGDRSELHWVGDDSLLWRRLDARSETCTGQKCSYFNQCYVTRMRQRALQSDLIVVNHALFFANLALESDEIGRVLPDFSVLILDEAHEVEDIAANHFGKQISSYQIEEFCRDFRKVFFDSSEFARRIDEVQDRSAAFFNSFPGLEKRDSLSFYRRPNGSVVDLRTEVLEQFQRFESSLLTLYHSLERQTRSAEADPLVRRLEQVLATLKEVFNLQDSDNVYWFEKRARGVFLHVTPIDIAPILQEKLFSRADTTIFTSATLATDNNFEYFKERLGIPEPREIILAGEFDYSEQSILYIPRSFPEPRSAHYLPRALREIEEILNITQGHAFLLFTSFAQMDRVYKALSERVSFPLFRQGEMPKNRLLQVFKETPHAVLCATSSFWQGVDVQGEALRVVIIDKLPFLVPTEPLVAARINRLEKEGRNSFLRYSVPEAIITLKQGLGRLIRSRQDRGILAVFDSRLRTRSYGQFFLRSLPNCPLTDNMEDLKKFFR
ncbi:ATP-dependent DNA helicase [Acidobacteria bacterium AH-259-O06]|nr:ATP-dependent DNA helicase [Acidobacteria bacterium AH-259-O06]